MINIDKNFRDNIVEELKILHSLDDIFFEKIRLLSLEDLIYLKLYLTYKNLNKKFLVQLPVFEIVDKIVNSVMKRFKEQFEELEGK